MLSNIRERRKLVLAIINARLTAGIYSSAYTMILSPLILSLIASEISECSLGCTSCEIFCHSQLLDGYLTARNRVVDETVDYSGDTFNPNPNFKRFAAIKNLADVVSLISKIIRKSSA